MTDLVVKYNSLNKTARQEVNDFIDFLLSRQKSNKADLLTAYKTKILGVTVWSDADCKFFEENQKLLNQWRIPEW